MIVPHEIRVIFGDTDQMGVVYYGNYMRFFEASRAAYWRGLGKSYRDLEAWGLKFGIAFQHADDILDDDQKSLRASALPRVDQLVAECDALAAQFGERAAALHAMALWVKERAHAAAAGVKAD